MVDTRIIVVLAVANGLEAQESVWDHGIRHQSDATVRVHRDVNLRGRRQWDVPQPTSTEREKCYRVQSCAGRILAVCLSNHEALRFVLTRSFAS